MVKEDCSQFQKSKGDRRDKDINWSYGKYEPKPEKKKEEIEKENKKQQELIEATQRGEGQPTIDDAEGFEFIEKK